MRVYNKEFVLVYVIQNMVHVHVHVITTNKHSADETTRF